MKMLSFRVFFLALGLLCVVALSAHAQKTNTQDLLAKYEYGKELLSKKQYELAESVFAAVARQEARNDIPVYARYLQARCLYELKQPSRAKEILEKLLAEEKDWNKIDEAKYLLGVIYFQQEFPERALATLATLRNSSLYAPARKIKEANLTLYTVEQLNYLHKQFESDTLLSRLLFEKMLTLPASERDVALFSKLAESFGNEDVTVNAQGEITIFKPVYNVAVMLPFFVDNFNRRTGAHQIAYDLFQGMKTAQKMLEEEGIQIRLHAFDTRQDSAQTAAILTDSTLLLMDLIVGPLFANTIPIVAEFSKQNGIPMLNPISSNSLVIADNPYGFLLHPTDETMGKQMGQFSMGYFKGSSAYIIYGKTEQEQKLAESYQRYLINQGGVIRMFEPFDYSEKGYNKLVKLLSKMGNVGEEAEALREFNIKQPTLPPVHIFAALRDPVSAVSLVSALQTIRASHAHIIAPPQWLEFNQLSYEQLESSKVHIFIPNKVQEDSSYAQQIKKRYAEEYYIPPFEYALDGIEALYTFGKAMHKHGTGFARAIHFEGQQSGILFEAINYVGGNDNQYVPVYTFRESRFVRVYPASEASELLEEENKKDKKNKR